MNVNKYFSIPWKGLSVGSHHFEFEVDDALFEEYGSEIRAGKARVYVDMERAATMLRLDIEIEGYVLVECDRCLDDIEYPIDYQGVLEVKFSEEIEEYDGDILWMNPADGELALAQYIYESIFLCLPYSRIHGEDAEGNSLCNPEMLSRFKIISGEEFDEMAADKGETLTKSPGADKLLELKKKLEKEQNK